MNKDKYVGLDVDQATIVAHVIDSQGNFVMETFLETKAEGIRQFLRSLEGRIRVVLEEGCMAGWLHDVVRPVVSEAVVCDPRRNKLIGSGNKGDRPDAKNLARLLRLGELRAVYHGERSIRDLKELVQSYDRLVQDSTRTMNRLKALYRGRAIKCRGMKVYSTETRSFWITMLETEAARGRAELLYSQLDSLNELRGKAEKVMTREARKQSAYNLIVKVPGLGPIRTAQILAEGGTPYRFRTKRQYWAYSGLAVVTHMSSEYEIVDGQRRRRNKPVQTRGLNKNYNRTLKAVYKGAAVTAILKDPFKQYYGRLIAKKIRPEMALLTVARKIAAITLAIWKKGEKFDPDRVNQAVQGAGDQC